MYFTNALFFQDFIENLSESEEDDDKEDMIELGNQFYLHKSIENKLYSYQKEGVLWFWELYLKKKGGILGDDMGQVIFIFILYII